MRKQALQQVSSWLFSVQSTEDFCVWLSRGVSFPNGILKFFQGGSHRASIYEDWDPFRFRHMIPLEALQVRALASAGNVAAAWIWQGS